MYSRNVHFSISITLIGSTFPDSSTVEEPDPARIWRENVVEQKKGSCTESITDWIWSFSVVIKCFLESALPTTSFNSKTTAGILPCALSLAANLLPVNSRGMASIVWYVLDICRDLLRASPAARRHCEIISGEVGFCGLCWFGWGV